MTKTAAVLIAALACAGTAGAGERDYIAAGVFYASPDAARGVDSGTGVNYGYARGFGERTTAELRLFGDTLETGIAGATDFYQYGLGVDLFQYFGAATRGHLFGVVGAGAIMNDVTPDSEDGTSAYAALGAGWRSAPWSGWGLRHRLEVRGVYDTFQSGQLDVLAGVTLEFGTERTKIVTVEKIVEVEKVVEVIREVPAPAVATAAVDADRDDDGVADERDRCPDTVAGAEVDPDGCVRKSQVVVLPNIEFEFGRAVLTSEGRGELEKVLRFLNDQDEIRLEVWGHTDAKGADVYNLRLSQDRAAAVVEFLTANGIQAPRLASAGFGETRPMADNETEEGRARNRRVELHIRTANAVGSRS